MAFRPYLAFKGNCREAFNRYQAIFGGDLVLLSFSDAPPTETTPPPGTGPDAVMHAALTTGEQLLMGADAPPGAFEGSVNGICVNYSTSDVTNAERVFGALAENGQVQMQIGPTFFSPAFGMCIDRFGVPWMISTDQS